MCIHYYSKMAPRCVIFVIIKAPMRSYISESVSHTKDDCLMQMSQKCVPRHLSSDPRMAINITQVTLIWTSSWSFFFLWFGSHRSEVVCGDWFIQVLNCRVRSSHVRSRILVSNRRDDMGTFQLQLKACRLMSAIEGFQPHTHTLFACSWKLGFGFSVDCSWP